MCTCLYARQKCSLRKRAWEEFKRLNIKLTRAYKAGFDLLTGEQAMLYASSDDDGDPASGNKGPWYTRYRPWRSTAAKAAIAKLDAWVDSGIIDRPFATGQMTKACKPRQVRIAHPNQETSRLSHLIGDTLVTDDADSWSFDLEILKRHMSVAVPSQDWEPRNDIRMVRGSSSQSVII